MRLARNQFKELIDTSVECTNLVVQTMTRRLTSIREYMRENNPLRVLVVGSQASEEARNVRAFLALNRIPYEWADVEREPERIPPWERAKSAAAFAIVDNSVFVGEPLTVRKIAVSLGVSTSPKSTNYEIVIVGGGPAGLAAAVYGASEGLSVLLLEKECHWGSGRNILGD